MSFSKYLLLWTFTLLALTAGCFGAMYGFYQIDLAPECCMIAAVVLAVHSCVFGAVGLFQVSSRKKLARSVGVPDHVFDCGLLDDDGCEYETKIVLGENGVLLDDGVSLIRCLYRNMTDWCETDDGFILSVRSDNVVREYEVIAKSELQAKAIEQNLERLC